MAQQVLVVYEELKALVQERAFAKSRALAEQGARASMLPSLADQQVGLSII